MEGGLPPVANPPPPRERRSSLQDFAEGTNVKARLRQFEPGLREHLHRGTHTLPLASFERKRAADFVPWRSRERAGLLLQVTTK